MCIPVTGWIIPPRPLFSCTRKQRGKRSNVQIHRLNRRKRKCEVEKVGTDAMELKNLKLYKENISIMEENDKLRKKAILLHQENLALMSELIQKKFPHFCNLLSPPQQY